MDKYLTLEELSEYTGLSETTLRDLVREEELKHFRRTKRGKILVRMSWWDEYVESQIVRREVRAEVEDAELMATAEKLWERIQEKAS